MTIKAGIYGSILLALAIAIVALGGTQAQNTHSSETGARTTGSREKTGTARQSVMNAAKDFWALNMGVAGVAFNFADVPAGTTNLKISRASSLSGPWTVAIDVPYSDDLPQPLVDLVDGTKESHYYQLQAFGKDRVIKTYGSLFVSGVRENQ